MKKYVLSLETLQELYELRNADQIKVFCAQIKKLIISGKKQFSKTPDKDIPTRKAEMIQYIISCLDSMDVLKAIYARLDSLEQSAVREAVETPSGKLDLSRFKAKYGSHPPLSNSWEYFRFSDRRDEIEFAWLSLWMTIDGIMPLELRERLKTFVKPPQKLAPVYLESLSETKVFVEDEDDDDDEREEIIVHSTENAAIKDVMAMLRLLEIGKIGVGAATGKPSKAGARMIRDALSVGDFYPDDIEAPHAYDIQMGDSGIRPFAWAILMQASKLAQVNGNKLGLSKSGVRALKKQAPDVLKQIWNSWLKSTFLHEMSRIEAIKGQKSKGRPLAAAPPNRQSIAQAMAELDEGKWIETGAFFKYMIASGNTIMVGRDTWKLYISDPHYGSLGYSHIAWEHIEGRFARAFLLEYAATLGLVDVALVEPWGAQNDIKSLWGADSYSCLSRYDGLTAIRLNSLGAWILGINESYDPVFHDEPCFQVLPNMDVSRIGPANPGDILFLERFCEKASDRVWRISPQKILECTENGVGVDEIRTFLKDRNREKLPQPVLAFLKDMDQRTGQIKDVGAARLVECASASVAQLIANDTGLKGLCMLAGKRHLAVPSENETQFKKALRKLGYGMVSNG